MKMFRDFKDFLQRGNVVDLAVAVVMGAAFTAIVAALVADFINPLIAIFIPSGSLDALMFTVGNSKFTYGHFIGAVINFVAIAFVVFLIVMGINKMMKKKPANTKDCPYCGSTIPDSAVRCPNCTTLLDADKVPEELR
ncbi:MAG TPA: large conductance mechanosensitive channel protein MscL [Coriobacteriia bacterium]|nr:large conductance mechanosensitive channel protein MscL [Coriobacteriia bacterium]